MAITSDQEGEQLEYRSDGHFRDQNGNQLTPQGSLQIQPNQQYTLIQGNQMVPNVQQRGVLSTSQTVNMKGQNIKTIGLMPDGHPGHINQINQHQQYIMN